MIFEWYHRLLILGSFAVRVQELYELRVGLLQLAIEGLKLDELLAEPVVFVYEIAVASLECLQV